MAIVAALKSLFGTAPVQQVELVQRDSQRISYLEWRQDEALTARARKALSSPDVQVLIDVLRSKSLLHWALPPDCPLDQRAVHAAKCEGYVLALNDLEDLGVLLKGRQQIEPNFEADNVFEPDVLEAINTKSKRGRR